MQTTTSRFRISKSTLKSKQPLATNENSFSPACQRCRKLKKRCSRTSPTCDQCDRSGQECSLTLTSSNSSNELERLRARLHQLESFIDSQAWQRSPETASALHQHFSAQDAAGRCAILTSDSRIEGSIYQACIEAYFGHVHRAYPFLDKNEVIGSVEYQNPNLLQSYKHSITHLVVAIGNTALQCAHKSDASSSFVFTVNQADTVRHCLVFPGLDSVRILMLLCLHSLSEPNNMMQTRSVVSLAVQQAIILGMTRQRFSHDVPHLEMELRCRLIWSLYGLDRMVSVSIGLPVCLLDSNMIVPQPAMTIDEFASPTRQDSVDMLKLNRHITSLRSLEYELVFKILFQKKTYIGGLPRSDRQAISEELRASIEECYATGCLIAAPEVNNIGVHGSITWLNAKSYNLLVILYYPCQFNSAIRKIPPVDLFTYVGKYMQYNSILLANNQLPPNSITFCRLTTSCLVLVYCYAKVTPKLQAVTPIEKCRDIVASFTAEWNLAGCTKAILSTLHDNISETSMGLQQTLQDMEESQRGTLSKTPLSTLATELLSILEQVAGPANCFLQISNELDN